MALFLRTSAGKAGKWRCAAAVLLLLFCIAAGGGTERAAQAVVLILSGLLILAWPARQRPPAILLWPGVFMLAWAFAALLPAGMGNLPAWREGASALGIQLGTSLSPQPALLTGSFPLLALGVCWALWPAGQGWSFSERKMLLRWFAFGLAGIALVALLAWAVGWSVPGWNSERHFGPFPNRNHTADLFCIGTILSLAAAEDRWYSRQKGWAIAHGFSALILGAATVMSYSRAGVVLLFAGCAVWILGLALISKRRSRVAVLGAIFAGALLVFLTIGGATAGRFLGVADSGEGFRGRIFRDTLTMISSAPLTGFGLGNFEGVFPQYRRESLLQQSVLHPENDWLFLAAEMGWLAALALGVAVAGSIRGAFPFEQGTERRVRLGALIAVGAFLLHGLVDVPGHRLGTVLPVLLFLSVAQTPVPDARESRTFRWLSRIAGLALIAMGSLFFIPRAELKDVDAALAAGENHAALEKAAEVIKREPLAWAPYFTRAMVYLRERQFLSALSDFRRARYVEPHQAAIPLYEARLWAKSRPELSSEAWRAAFQRPPGGERVQQLREFLSIMPRNGRTDVLAWEIAGDDPELLLELAHSSGELLATKALDRLAAKESTLSANLREKLVKVRAIRAAEGGDYAGAVRLVLEGLAVTLPATSLTIPEASLRERLDRDAGDFAAGYSLFLLLKEQGNGEEAFQLARKMARQPECPAYFRVFAARYLAERGLWREAWDSLGIAL